jgi:hypothetical protein
MVAGSMSTAEQEKYEAVRSLGLSWCAGTCGNNGTPVFGEIYKKWNENNLASRILEDMKMWSIAGVGGTNLE